MIPDFPHTYYENKIGPIEFFLLHPDFAESQSLPCWLSQFSWDSQQGREFATTERNKKFFDGA